MSGKGGFGLSQSRKTIVFSRRTARSNATPCASDWCNESKRGGESLRACIRRRRPYGDDSWTRRTPRKMDLEASLRPCGRPPKKKAAQRALLFGEAEPE